LEEAGWVLNPIGLSVFHQAILMYEKKKKNFTFEGDTLFEKYTGKKTRGYVGEYQTNGEKCNCSWFKNILFCHHQIWFRDHNNLPIFDINMFNKVLTKPDQNVDSVEEGTIEFDEDTDDIFHETNSDNNNESDYTAPSSPGMEYLLHEEREARKKPPKNEKYNK
jgi:hypothetical protein